MASVNKVILVGHLGKDPEVRYLEGNITVCSFPLATSETYTKDGIRMQHTEWHNIVMWRNLAEMAVKYLKKGKLVYIEGRLRTRNYEDREGNRRFVTEIVGESFKLLGRPSDFGQGGKAAPEGTADDGEKEQEVDFLENDNDRDGLPF
ncbi:single-strand binding protein [Sphingobacterium allocomposti]|uniref:Single-stranded DNA-binding protein n=1 Tax=Sphingobacterium allocomposti TaxID=415956 RepID=A0A5S5DIQ9_9SPHI|nr:single-stranded DNA-binding protein [Sphingobacterium composti Yoo et al. 2007 non Ten et al. 2007]TYP95811.1 single-strand binding protein [Sphingobacterium composti Yoo et al. 2007 non Ten et al. 2007]